MVSRRKLAAFDCNRNVQRTQTVVRLISSKGENVGMLRDQYTLAKAKKTAKMLNLLTKTLLLLV